MQQTLAVAAVHMATAENGEKLSFDFGIHINIFKQAWGSGEERIAKVTAQSGKEKKD